jgi:NTP pyrophosphatase (non-canonical NTP hydrolase)
MAITFKDYQNKTQETAIYPTTKTKLDSKSVEYINILQNIVNDLMVVTTSIKKTIRDTNGTINNSRLENTENSLSRISDMLSNDTISESKTLSDKEISLLYTSLGVIDESLELFSKMVDPDVKKEEIAKEIGDVLWYLSQLSTELELSLGRIAKDNLEKLKSRKERSVLTGDGDNR